MKIHSFVSIPSFAMVVVLMLVDHQHHPCVYGFSSVPSIVSCSRNRHVNDASSLVLLSATADAKEDSSASTATATPRKKPLSPKEILARQREMQGLPADEYPKLFEDDLLDNMQQILLTLEKRVKEGPGSLSILEVEEFISMSNSVAMEMKEKEYARLQDAGGNSSPPSSKEAATVAATTPATSTAEVLEMPDAEKVQVESTDAPKPDSDNEDGPAYDPAGGQGSLAKGTRNTYVIPNMNEMSPEEYQKALQQSIIDEQAERRKKIGAGYGNRATWDYLNNLSGESGLLRKDELED